MKSLFFSLLLSSLLHSFVHAQDTPLFTQKEASSYIGDGADSVNVAPDDIEIDHTDDLILTLGADVSAKLHDVTTTRCQDPSFPDCGREVNAVLGLGANNNEKGLQIRWVPCNLFIPAVFALVGVIIEWVWLAQVNPPSERRSSSCQRTKRTKRPNGIFTQAIVSTTNLQTTMRCQSNLTPRRQVALLSELAANLHNAVLLKY
jgi:hypothetical protein